MKILQVYLSWLSDVNVDIFKRAKDRGFIAIAVTVDSNILGNWENEERNNFSYPSHLRLGLREKYLNGMKPPAGISLKIQSETLKDNSFDWSWISELREMTTLPIILKGIHCWEDAIEAVNHKVDAIWVSNHGGR